MEWRNPHSTVGMQAADLSDAETGSRIWGEPKIDDALELWSNAAQIRDWKSGFPGTEPSASPRILRRSRKSVSLFVLLWDAAQPCCDPAPRVRRARRLWM